MPRPAHVARFLDVNLNCLLAMPFNQGDPADFTHDVRYHEAGHTVVAKYTSAENTPRKSLAWRGPDGRTMGISTAGDVSEIGSYDDPLESMAPYVASIKSAAAWDWDRSMVVHLAIYAAGYAAEIIRSAAWHKFGPRTGKIYWIYGDERSARAMAQIIEGGSFERYAMPAFMLAGEVLMNHWREVVELAEAVEIQPAPPNVLNFFQEIEVAITGSK